jgi:hypothetical protein
MAETSFISDSDFLRDNLRLRTASFLLKTFPSKDIEPLNCVTKLGPVITKDRDRLSLLHKLSFLLVQYQEVVAAMPVQVANKWSIMVAFTDGEESRYEKTKDTSSDEELQGIKYVSILVRYNLRFPANSFSTIQVKRPTYPKDIDVVSSVEEFLAAKW